MNSLFRTRVPSLIIALLISSLIFIPETSQAKNIIDSDLIIKVCQPECPSNGKACTHLCCHRFCSKEFKSTLSDESKECHNLCEKWRQNILEDRNLNSELNNSKTPQSFRDITFQ